MLCVGCLAVVCLQAENAMCLKLECLLTNVTSLIYVQSGLVELFACAPTGKCERYLVVIVAAKEKADNDASCACIVTTVPSSLMALGT